VKLQYGTFECDMRFEFIGLIVWLCVWFFLLC